MDHEKLDVYCVALEVVTRIGAILKSKDIDRSLRDQVFYSRNDTEVPSRLEEAHQR